MNKNGPWAHIFESTVINEFEKDQEDGLIGVCVALLKKVCHWAWTLKF